MSLHLIIDLQVPSRADVVQSLLLADENAVLVPSDCRVAIVEVSDFTADIVPPRSPSMFECSPSVLLKRMKAGEFDAENRKRKRRAHVVDVVGNSSIAIPLGHVNLRRPSIRKVDKPESRLIVQKKVSQVPRQKKK